MADRDPTVVAAVVSGFSALVFVVIGWLRSFRICKSECEKNGLVLQATRQDVLALQHRVREFSLGLPREEVLVAVEQGQEERVRVAEV
jgi:hypothetical protein